jgi:hypothetical protein
MYRGSLEGDLLAGIGLAEGGPGRRLGIPSREQNAI